MSTLQQWMVVLVVLTIVATLVTLYVRHLKARCFALVQLWAREQELTLDSGATELHLFYYPLSASCVYMSNDGVKTKCTLMLGTHWRGILLRRAKLGPTEQIQ